MSEEPEASGPKHDGERDQGGLGLMFAAAALGLFFLLVCVGAVGYFLLR